MAESESKKPLQNPLKGNSPLKAFLAFTLGAPPCIAGEIFQHPDRDFIPGNLFAPHLVVDILDHLPNLQATGSGLVAYSFVKMAESMYEQRPRVAIQDELINAGFHPEQVGRKKNKLRAIGQGALSLAAGIVGYKLGEMSPHWLVLAGVGSISYGLIKYEEYYTRKTKTIE